MNLVLSKRKVLASACLLAGLLVFLSVGAGAQILAPSKPPDWAQWGLNSQHTLFDGGVVGQPSAGEVEEFTAHASERIAFLGK